MTPTGIPRCLKKVNRLVVEFYIRQMTAVNTQLVGDSNFYSVRRCQFLDTLESL